MGETTRTRTGAVWMSIGPPEPREWSILEDCIFVDDSPGPRDTLIILPPIWKGPSIPITMSITLVEDGDG